jgi:mRNA-degrading endonuclease YafQ of YafQ-DinJ toxin-antitoxin module
MDKVANWQVKLMRAAEHDLVEMCRNGTITEDEQIVIQKWAQTIIEGGPHAVRGDDKIWKDHELKSEWLGHRASSFSSRGRLIYQIDENIVRVRIVRITATHDYSKEQGR